MSIPGQCSSEELLDPCAAKYSVTGRTTREECVSMCKLLLIDMVKNTGRVEQMANRHIEGKADEYSSKRAWSSIGEQYPDGLTRGVIQVHTQWSRQEKIVYKWKANGQFNAQGRMSGTRKQGNMKRLDLRLKLN